MVALFRTDRRFARPCPGLCAVAELAAASPSSVAFDCARRPSDFVICSKAIAAGPVLGIATVRAFPTFALPTLGVCSTLTSNFTAPFAFFLAGSECSAGFEACRKQTMVSRGSLTCTRLNNVHTSVMGSFLLLGFGSLAPVESACLYVKVSAMNLGAESIACTYLSLWFSGQHSRCAFM